MSQQIYVEPFSMRHSEVWDKLIDASKNGVFFHKRAFMDYHGDRFDDCSKIVFDGNKPIGVFPANRTGELVASHAGLTFGGFLYDKDIRATQVIAGIAALFESYRLEGARSLLYKAVPATFHRYPAEEAIYALFLHDAKVVRRDLSSVVIKACRPKIKKSRKDGLRRARKAGLVIKSGQFVDKFHALLSESLLERHSTTPTHSAQEMKLLQSRFPQNIELYGAFHEENLCAGAWIFRFDDVAHTQYLCCSTYGLGIGALDYLIDQIIGLPEEHSKILSFGISTEDSGRILNEGLIFQKEGFGGAGVVLDQYEVQL